jgi:ubiquitin carboxyl-terminal hydrolase 14
VRFYWRREINKKAKIMRKVKFPFEYDVLDLCTPELKAKIKPLNEKLKLIDRDRRERTKIRTKVRRVAEEKEREKEVGMVEDLASRSGGVDIKSKKGKIDSRDVSSDPGSSKRVDPNAMEVDEGKKKEEDMYLTIEEEVKKRREEDEELRSLVSEEIKNDRGANYTAIYELWGIVTHKGASADGGKR